ncbi:MAG: LysR family transcriptional regulator [Coprococcus sp.]|nr:LysR family transcriptional regulator [Coprococcus sp.]
MDINFEYYKIFYYAAKYRNITKAAAALGSNQPNVTRIMKLLEAQLKCRLFIREPRGIRLTEEGEKLYYHVEAACRHLFNAQEEISGEDLEDRGTVEIGATESALHLYLLELLHDFKVKYPKIRIKVHNQNTSEIIKYFISGRLDFAVVTSPFKEPENVQCETVYDFDEILVGGMRYEHLGKEKLCLNELSEYPWIGLERGTVTYDFYRDFFIRHRADLELDMEVATSDILIPLIQSNLGIGFIPEKLAIPLLDEKKLVQIPLNCEAPRRAIKLISDKRRARNKAADAFYTMLHSKK